MQKLIMISALYWPAILGVILAAVAYFMDCPIWGVLATVVVGIALTYLWLKAFNGMHFM